MTKKAIILDLDNTIYPVASIGDNLFGSLFDHIESNGEFVGDFDIIRADIMRIPFQKVAREYRFSSRLTNECVKMLNELTYDGELKTFDDYPEIRKIQCKKFLVTTGFERLQQSKIRQLQIENDFDKIYIIDPGKSELSKKDIFRTILKENNYNNFEVLIIGDDINSEIRAGQELGIDVVLYDYNSQISSNRNLRVINSFKNLDLN